MTQTYEDTITWMAQDAWRRWNKEDEDLSLGWRCAIGPTVNLAAFVYNSTPYDINQAVWNRVEELFGNPLKGTPPTERA